jgi:fermentation-respiration switch protein FrsA (DUF1100 family)
VTIVGSRRQTHNGMREHRERDRGDCPLGLPGGDVVRPPCSTATAVHCGGGPTAFDSLTADGSGLVALSYRGYGGSSGRPTETGLIADAAAAYAFAIARYPAERIVLWGESLGSAVALALALVAEKPVCGATSSVAAQRHL